MFVEKEGVRSIQNVNHLSPDFLLDHTQSEAADVWSVGFLLFYMLNGTIIPFGNPTPNWDYRTSTPAEVIQRCEKFSYQKYSNNKDNDERLGAIFRQIFDP